MTTATCGFCACVFVPSARQLKRARGKGAAAVFCSSFCVRSNLSQVRRKVRPLHGPCPTCGQVFRSRQPKRFCSLACYSKSDQLRQVLAVYNARAAAAAVAAASGGTRTKKEPFTCLFCGTMMNRRPSRRARFCSSLCYREHQAARFDRWMANPDTIRLPQSFDEFLTGTELPCLVDGCSWRGRHLSMHVNMAHGVKAADFKRAAGFNLGSGLVSVDLHRLLCEQNSGKGSPGVSSYAEIGREAIEGTVLRYRSLEAQEHSHKAQIEARLAPGPVRICKGCGSFFQQSSPMGRAKYCSVPCRSRAYHRTGERLMCWVCGGQFDGSADQTRRSKSGRLVVCSFHCRQRRAGFISRRTWPGDHEWVAQRCLVLQAQGGHE